MKKIVLGLTAVLMFTSLSAEIISVKMKWNNVACARDCRNNMESLLRKTKGVDAVSIDSGFGEATLNWNPTAPFNLEALIQPIRSYGVRLQAVNISVKGTISHQGETFYLISSGDNTKFQLLGPTVSEASGTNRYVMERSSGNHPLPAAMKAQLIDVEKNGQEVTIEGPMYNIEYHKLIIIVSSVKYPPKAQDQ